MTSPTIPPSSPPPDPHTTSGAPAESASPPSASGAPSPPSTLPAARAAVVLWDVPELDPTEIDWRQRSAMPEAEQMKRRTRQVTHPMLTAAEMAAWNQIRIDIFGRDEEWAVRFAMMHLIRCIGSVETSKIIEHFRAETRRDTMYWRQLERQQWEEKFAIMGDIVAEVVANNDVEAAVCYLNEALEILEKQRTEPERSLLVRAAHNTDFWKLVRFVAGLGPGNGDDPDYVGMAQRWQDAWLSCRGEG